MEFQPENESWDSYKERLEHFFAATNIIDDEKKVFTLIHQNGSSLYTLLKELSFPKNPTLMSYADIMDLLKRHYVGAKSVFYERKVFLGAQMKPYESASEWHRRLRGLILNCAYGGFVEDVLVDKFITGFHGKVLQRLYEQDENISLQQALEIAQRYENDSTFIDKGAGPKAGSSSESKRKPQSQYVHEEQSRTQPSQHRHNYQKQQEQQYQQQRQPQQQHVQQRPKQQYQPQIKQVQQQQTREHVVTCYKCGKKGHYANVCRSGNAKKSQQEETSECCIS